MNISLVPRVLHRLKEKEVDEWGIWVNLPPSSSEDCNFIDIIICIIKIDTVGCR